MPHVKGLPLGFPPLPLCGGDGVCARGVHVCVYQSLIPPPAPFPPGRCLRRCCKNRTLIQVCKISGLSTGKNSSLNSNRLTFSLPLLSSAINQLQTSCRKSSGPWVILMNTTRYFHFQNCHCCPLRYHFRVLIRGVPLSLLLHADNSPGVYSKCIHVHGLPS